MVQFKSYRRISASRRWSRAPIAMPVYLILRKVLGDKAPAPEEATRTAVPV